MSQDVSYLAAFFLPKDGRWRVTLGATEEGYGATRSCDLVPWPNHDLRGHCNTEGREKCFSGDNRNDVFLYVCVWPLSVE